MDSLDKSIIVYLAHLVLTSGKLALQKAFWSIYPTTSSLGCVPQGKPDADYIRGLSVLGVQQIDRVVEVVEETLKGNQVCDCCSLDKFSLRKIGPLS